MPWREVKVLNKFVPILISRSLFVEDISLTEFMIYYGEGCCTLCTSICVRNTIRIVGYLTGTRGNVSLLEDTPNSGKQ